MFHGIMAMDEEVKEKQVRHHSYYLAITLQLFPAVSIAEKKKLPYALQIYRLEQLHFVRFRTKISRMK